MSIVEKLIGPTLATHEEDEQKVGPLTGIAMLGLDALASAAYGPEATLTLLLPLGTLGLVYMGPITAVILALLTILYLSYRQTTAAYPTGGGSYTVAKVNLGKNAGLLAAAALLLDYLLNVSVGIAAGVGALVSAVPMLQPHILSLCLAILFVIAFVNLRGIRESGAAFVVPTYLFVGALGVTLVVGFAKIITSGGHPHPIVAPPTLPAATMGVGLWLLMRAFANGCTAMTGVEAISNGISAFAKPAVRNAQRALTGIVLILGILLAGIAYLCRMYHIGATDPSGPGYQSVLSQLISAIMGHGLFYYVSIGSILAVLCLSANTSFADFPRLCRLLAEDDFLPHAFANRGRRLVYSLGIIILTLFSALLLTAFGGITDRLIPLFAIGAFAAFTLSQAGMVVHWRRVAKQRKTTQIQLSMLINGIGALATLIALIVVIATKFMDGAWITLLLIPILLMLFNFVQRHYAYVRQETKCPRPLDLSSLGPPVIVVPISGWNTVAEKALRFALELSPDVIGVHISTNEEEETQLRNRWTGFVEQPLAKAGLPLPRLTIISSPYRRLFTPLLNYVQQLKDDYPSRIIAVIIPELVEAHWYEYLLHNQRATGLKAALLLRGDHRVVVINVPWYLGDEAKNNSVQKESSQT